MCAKKATNSKGKKKAPTRKAPPKKKNTSNVKVVGKNPSSSTPPPAKKPPIAAASPVSKEADVLPFGRMNYLLLGLGVFIIALGFFLMSLDDFVDATQFSISLYIAPVVVVAGFIEIIYAIMYQPKQEKPSIS